MESPRRVISTFCLIAVTAAVAWDVDEKCSVTYDTFVCKDVDSIMASDVAAVMGDLWNLKYTGLLPALHEDEFKNLSVLHLLELRNVGLTKIHRTSFAALTSLNSLDLANNQLRDIHQGVFDNQVNLIFLNLSHNKLSFIDSRALTSLTNLQVLNLKTNDLIDLPIGVFQYQSRLTKLILAYNRLNLINEYGVFEGLRSLTSLDMSHNGMLDLNSVIFYPLVSLKYLVLDGNNFKYMDAISNIVRPNLQISLVDTHMFCLELYNIIRQLKRNGSKLYTPEGSRTYYKHNIDGVECNPMGY